MIISNRLNKSGYRHMNEKIGFLGSNETILSLLLGIAFIGLILILFSGDANAATLTVDDDGGADFTKIQDAINFASDGDTIIVRDGIYYENIDVNKRLTLRSENGPANCIVNASNPSDYVFYVTADYVNISGFTVENAKVTAVAGIWLGSVSYCNISNNNVSNNDYGIVLGSSWWVFSSNNIITSNNISNNDYGIFLGYCSNNNIITGNTVSSNNPYGIWLDSSSNNIITGNNVSHNHHGIHLWESSNNIITGNNASSSTSLGISLRYHSNNNNITGNNASNNLRGIMLNDRCDNNNITWNTIFNNSGYGIYFYSSCNNNNIMGNNVSSNPIGISLGFCNNNVIYNNYFDNNNDVIDNRNNIWNIKKTFRENIIGGPYLGGNYWHEYSAGWGGSDTDGDGLGDTFLPFALGISSGGDYHPLVSTTSTVFNLDTGEGFTTIQDAIDDSNTNDGDTIKILPGIYRENVVINKEVLIVGDPLLDGNGSIGFSVEANNTRIENFTIYNCSDGVYVHNALFTLQNVKIDNCTIYGCTGNGIEFDDVIESLINNTQVNNTNHGIHLDSSNTNTITNNNITNNDYGIRLDASSNNVVYNNYFNNSNNARDNGNNKWNITKTLGTNIIGGPYLGGNYWNDYTGVDTDGDKLGDTLLPYNTGISTGGDYHPLIFPPVENLDTGKTFFTIQGVIDDADTLAGHTIFVKNGIYYENVIVNKAVTLTGEDRNGTIINGGGTGDVVRVTADWVNISEFTLTNSGSSGGDAGLDLASVRFCYVTNTNCSNNDYFGIYLYNSSNNTLSGNHVYNNSVNGIELGPFTVNAYNTLIYNEIHNNGVSGIYFHFYEVENEIISNNVTGNSYGIFLDNVEDNYVIGNTLSENTIWDLYVLGSPENIFENNTFSSYPTTASFTYNGDFTVNGVDVIPPEPNGYLNISKALNITDLTPGTWVNVTMYYDDSDLPLLQLEHLLDLWEHYGTWYQFGWDSWRNIDMINNEVSANITDFGSIFVPLAGENIPPVTVKEIGEPKYDSWNWITTSTPIWLYATDNPGGSGVNATYYRIWEKGVWHPNSPIDYYCGNQNIYWNGSAYWYIYFLNGSIDFGPIYFHEECTHYIEFYSVDLVGNEENITNQTHYVDDSPPTTTIEFGLPYHTDGITEWITSLTTIYLNATDNPSCACGVKEIHYNYGEGWNIIQGDKATFTIPDECEHTIQWYAIDNFGHTESTSSRVVKVDNTPPVTEKDKDGKVMAPECKNWALIVVSTNDFYNGMFNLDTDGFPAQGLQAYYTLKAHGYQDDHIIFGLWHDYRRKPCGAYYRPSDDYIYKYYGSPNYRWGPDGIEGTADDPEIDADHDEHYLDGTPMVSKSWLLDQLDYLASVCTDDDIVTIYLVNHGSSTGFHFEDPANGVLSGTEFNTKLNAIPHSNMFIFVDMCESGDLLDQINVPNSCEIGASGDSLCGWYWPTAYAQTGPSGGYSGSFFFHYFWEKIKGGWSCEQAYNYACQHLEYNPFYPGVGGQYETVEWIQDPHWFENKDEDYFTPVLEEYVELCHTNITLTAEDEATGDDPNGHMSGVAYIEYKISLWDDSLVNEFPPAGWEEVVYGGEGHWEKRHVDGSWRDPLNAEGYYAIADSDSWWYKDYNVGLRTPSLDLSGCNAVTLDCDIAKIYWGPDDAYIRTLSGGIIAEELAHWDQDMGQFHFQTTFDPSLYADPSDVQIEFYYTTNGFHWVWFFSVDNIVVTCDSTIVFEETFDPWVKIQDWTEYTEPFCFQEECTHKLEWRAVDCVGNVEDIHIEIDHVDNTPPETTKTYGRPFYTHGGENYINSSTLISLSAIDGPECASGVKETWYNVSQPQLGIWGEWTLYMEPFTIPDECVHTIYYYSIDWFGNIEDINSQVVNVDNTPPTTWKEYIEVPLDPVYYEDDTMEISASIDSDDRIYTTEDDFIIPQVFGQDISWTSTPTQILWNDQVLTGTTTGDLAGTVTMYHHSIIPTEGTYIGTGFSRGIWEWTDGTGGFDGTYVADHSGFFNTHGKVYAVGYGAYTGQYFEGEFTGVVDSQTDTFTATMTFHYATYLTTQIQVNLNATDLKAPCSVGSYQVFYRINYLGTWGSWIAGPMNSTASFMFTEECEHILEWYVVDDLGQESMHWFQRYYVDDTRPKTTDDSDTEWHDPDVTVTLTAIDPGICASGVAYTYYKVDDGPWMNGPFGGGASVLIPAPADHSNDGIHVIQYYSVDNVGNVEVDPSCVVKIKTNSQPDIALDQSFTATEYAQASEYSDTTRDDRQAAQSFVPSVPNLRKVSLYLSSRYNRPFTLTVEIQTNAKDRWGRDQPSNNVLYSVSKYFTKIPSQPTWIDFDVFATLNPDEKYWIVLKDDDLKSTTNYVKWWQKWSWTGDGETYLDGEKAYSPNNGGYWYPTTSGDRFFKTFGY